MNKKVYITKYALSQGIIETCDYEFSNRSQDKSWIYSSGHFYDSYKIGRDAFFDRDEAIKDAYNRRDKKIKSLKKQIDKLNTLKFE